MKELKCPKCGSAITVDEADYASIINQVKTSEFEAEVCKRINELKAQQAAQQQGGAAPGGEAPKGGDDDVIDAEVVNDDK